MATMKTLNGYGFNATEFNGKTAAEIMLDLYPVGAVYISVNSTSPASLFGGTWEQIKDRFLLGAGDSYAAGSTGGEATNTIEVNNLPSQIPLMYSNNFGSSGSGGIMSSAVYTSGENSGYAWLGTGRSATPLSNMPPYLAVYMWKRVS